MNDRLKDYIDRFIDNLGELDDGHEGSLFEAYGLFYVAAFPANMAAKGRASKTMRIEAIFSPFTCIHSQTNDVPAGVLVTRSYSKHTSLPSMNIFFISTRSTTLCSFSSACRYGSGLSKLSIGPRKERLSCKNFLAEAKSPLPIALMNACTTWP